MRRLASLALAPLLLLSAGAARATTYGTKDYGGGAVTLVDGDILSGTLTNVGLLTLEANATAYVASGVNLEVYASTVAIYGTLDGSGRGMQGGAGGLSSNGTGQNGSAGDSGGQGAGGAAGKGGGGGAAAGSGGAGAGPGGAGGAVYGSTGVAVSLPLSADDSFQGSGGGGGGANTSLNGGNGGAGGASIYIEASSMTVMGTITVNGSTATPVTDGNAGTHPGGGGGGSGGTIVLRVTSILELSGAAKLSADGGKGGNVDTALGGTLEPGGGGSGGRVNVFARAWSAPSVIISTAGGAAGGKTTGFSGTVDAANPPGAGGVGSSTFGIVAAPVGGLTARGVYVSSINWAWTASASFGDGPSTAAYRLFGSTVAPLTSPQLVVASSVLSSTEAALTPNTTYYRVVTAFTDWGDSLPSNAVSTHTLANLPGAAAAAFSAMGDVTATFNWTANSPANPSYTSYEVNRSTSSNFSAAVSTSFVVGLSSAPSGLLPNTTYYWRARAVNLDGVPSDFAAIAATATLAAAPSAPAFGTVFVTSASFAWSGGANPPDTLYEAQISTDNFFSLAASSRTLATSATFFAMTPNTQVYFRAYALNRNSVASAFSAVISTRSGNLADLTSPATPGTPVADRQFSYDGAATFAWAPAQSSVGILDYHLIIGSTPGGNDVWDVTATSTSYAVTGLASGRSYYARVSGRSNAGVTSPFSGISQGLPVFITTQANPLEKAINWPNPFNPATGPTQIGFVLSSPADVELKIFTLQGRQVHSQNYSFGAAGNQIVTWDGRNDSGGKVAPGGYIGLIEKHYSGRTDTQKLKIAVLY